MLRGYGVNRSAAVAIAARGLVSDLTATKLAAAKSRMFSTAPIPDFDHRYPDNINLSFAHSPTAMAEEIEWEKEGVANVDLNKYDKILIFMHHGEDESQVMGSEFLDSPGSNRRNPGLTRRGFGQSLDLSRKMAQLCNDDTRVKPDLVTVAPLKSSLQTALMALPQFSPESVRNVPWVCNEDLLCYSNRTKHYFLSEEDISDLKYYFPGIDFTLCEQERKPQQHEYNLLQKADHFLEWVKEREECVIVGKCILRVLLLCRFLYPFLLCRDI